MSPLTRRLPDTSTTRYSQACITCGRSTDTMIVARGEVEWHLTTLALLGIPRHRALRVLEKQEWFIQPTILTSGDRTHLVSSMNIHVCGTCLDRSRLRDKIHPVNAANNGSTPLVEQTRF